MIRFNETRSFLKAIVLIITVVLVLAPGIVLVLSSYSPPVHRIGMNYIASASSTPDPSPSPGPGPIPYLEPPNVIIYPGSNDGSSGNGGGSSGDGDGDEDGDDDRRYEAVLFDEPAFLGIWCFVLGSGETEDISLLDGRGGRVINGHDAWQVLLLQGTYGDVNVQIRLDLSNDGENFTGTISERERISPYSTKLSDPIGIQGKYNYDPAGIPDNFEAFFSFTDWYGNVNDICLSGYLTT